MMCFPRRELGATRTDREEPGIVLGFPARVCGEFRERLNQNLLIRLPASGKETLSFPFMML